LGSLRLVLMTFVIYSTEEHLHGGLKHTDDMAQLYGLRVSTNEVVVVVVVLRHLRLHDLYVAVDLFGAVFLVCA
jgi:ATP/ADP translocase